MTAIKIVLSYAIFIIFAFLVIKGAFLWCQSAGYIVSGFIVLWLFLGVTASLGDDI